MPAKPNVDYQPFNASPEGIPETRTRGDYLEVHATPNQMGGQVGAALQNLGKTGEQLGSAENELAIKQQGIINETLATNAESQLIQRNAQAKGDFMSKEGMEAYSSLPEYVKTISDDSKIRQNLPAGALRQYDMLANRQRANYISDATSYATGQLKKANMMGHASLVSAAELSTKDPDVANNPERIGDALATASFSHGAMMDENTPGIKTNEDGSTEFEDSHAGATLRAGLQNNVDYSHGIIWQNAITTIADQNPIKAKDMFDSNKDLIPRAAQVRIESFLNPRIDEYKTSGIVSGTIVDAQQQHQNFLLNPTKKNDLSFTMQHEGGYVSNDSGRGPTNFGINQEANPDIDVKSLTKEQAEDIIQKRYADPVGANDMSPSMAKVATDTAVNMGVEKTKKLLIQSGNDPQKLIDLRREEYKRLATENPARYGGSLPGWNSRLDDLQKEIKSGEAAPVKESYAKNPDGSPVSLPDYYASHREEILAKGDAIADRDFPGNPTYKTMVRERLNQQMNSAISSQAAQYKQDNQFIMKAVTGGLTHGTTPMTFEELRATPGVAQVLDRVAVQDPKFYEGIDRMISHVAQRAINVNSQNGYETIMRTLQPNDQDHPNRIDSQDHLDRLLGRTDGTGINMKDYTDAKKSVEASPLWKTFLSDNMKTITAANGNVDGKGQERALDWYNKVVSMKEKNEAKGEKAISESEFIDMVKNQSQLPQPSRMEQISNWAKSIFNDKPQQQTPTFSDPNDPEFAKLPPGSQFMVPGEATPRVKH